MSDVSQPKPDAASASLSGSVESKQTVKDNGIYFPNSRDYGTEWIRAETAGKAKYLYYLRFSDAYDMTFKEFLKKIKVVRILSNQ